MGDINTIVLDIGNVLIDYRWKDYLNECGYEEDVIRKITKATVKNKRWNEWDRGTIEKADLTEYCCKQEPDVEKEIRKLFDDILLFLREFDYSADFVKQLKMNGYMVYLLSNYSKSSFEAQKDNFKFMQYVDGGVISYKIKSIKPEPQIYKTLINKYNLKPAEAVFLDDTQENLDGAKPFGFHTILVKSHEQAIEDLRKLGVKI